MHVVAEYKPAAPGAVVEHLEMLLEKARKGEVTSIMYVTYGPKTTQWDEGIVGEDAYRHADSFIGRLFVLASRMASRMM